MKNKIVNKFIIGSLCAIMAISTPITAFATEATTQEISQEVTQSEDEETNSSVDATDTENPEEISEENLENEQDGITEDAEEIVEENANEIAEEENIDTSVYIDGKKYSGDVVISLKFKGDGKSSLTSGTVFKVQLENTKSSVKKEVTVKSSDLVNGIDVTVPVGEYYVSSQATLNGKNSNARLVFNAENNTQSALLIENGQTLDFTLEGDIKTETTETTVEDKPEETKPNFWLNLLKNNALFLILLFGCGAFLLIRRIKQDNQ